MNGLPMAVLLMVSASTLVGQDVNELVVEQDSFRFYSAFWPNLHNLLWAEAWAGRPASASEPSPAGKLPEPLTGALTREERAAWDAAVSYYDREVADLNLLFEMGPIRKAMIGGTGALPTTGLEPEHRRVLMAAAPVYRKYWWPSHDRANRAWIAETVSRATALSPGVPNRLARLYGTPWFMRPVRVDVVRIGSREGAYTSIDPAPAHITTSSGSPTNQGWAAAEILFHEASHALVQPMIQAFSAELRVQGKNSAAGPLGARNIDLWHPALFYLTGEVVRQALAARDVVYVPYLYETGLLDRTWPRFRAALETDWKPYVNGEASRDEAIKNVVTSIK
jgi:hypothetical protein